MNEIRSFIADRVQQAEKLFAALPDELIERSVDQLRNAYIDAHNVDLARTRAALFGPFEHVSSAMDARGHISPTLDCCGSRGVLLTAR